MTLGILIVGLLNREERFSSSGSTREFNWPNEAATLSANTQKLEQRKQHSKDCCRVSVGKDRQAFYQLANVKSAKNVNDNEQWHK